MESIGCHEARTHFSKLLQRVAGGETFAITRRGVAVGILEPRAASSKEKMAAEAAAGLRALRAKIAARGVNVTAAEVREWKCGANVPASGVIEVL